LSCIPQKEKDDEIKLWHETNDGMYWVHKSSGPDKGKFKIIGMQVAGQTIHLNVLIRDRKCTSLLPFLRSRNPRTIIRSIYRNKFCENFTNFTEYSNSEYVFTT
jgi:hypothetical protein